MVLDDLGLRGNSFFGHLGRTLTWIDPLGLVMTRAHDRGCVASGDDVTVLLFGVRTHGTVVRPCGAAKRVARTSKSELENVAILVAPLTVVRGGADNLGQKGDRSRRAVDVSERGWIASRRRERV